MNYRGTVQGGVVVLDTGSVLQDGQIVDVTPAESDEDDGLPAAGLWRDRSDLGETIDAARDLRRTTNQRGY